MMCFFSQVRYTPRMGLEDTILYRDDSLLVVHKRAGELTVAADGEGPEPLFDRWKKTEPSLRVVHRLDFATSGVVVFARSAQAADAIRTSKFAGWRKEYLALVHGIPAQRSGVISNPLKARTHDGLVQATTRYWVRETFGGTALLALTIETGRKHQIRQHCKKLGHPLVLDPLYGDLKRDRAFKHRFKYRRFFLHAARLEFPHPITGVMVRVEAPLPPAFQEVLAALRSARASR